MKGEALVNIWFNRIIDVDNTGNKVSFADCPETYPKDDPNGVPVKELVRQKLIDTGNEKYITEN